MNTITEKYIPIIKITKNLMEVIFKKFNVSYDGKFHERRRKIQELCTHPKWNQVYDELVKEGLWDPNYVQKEKKKESIVNLIQHIIKKIDQLEENQTNMMKIVESQRKTYEESKINMKKTTLDFIFEENLKLAAYRSTTRMIVSNILVLQAKDSFNQIRYPGRGEASRVAKKCNSLLSKQKSSLMNLIFKKRSNNFGEENSEQRKKIYYKSRRKENLSTHFQYYE
ncbi:hypothetical protein M0812_23910 [Anaeramoeba flamelloides]|uniref:Uncharacterized protein n=2 Tax=Anaeramoeba flamelloides TaxID=1746091 RepID=A0AAV7YLT4_9EUKA|nr:hypothetical protein M0812_23910 [Anaeramoeba flamelloides]